jgi:hypothetical protein
VKFDAFSFISEYLLHIVNVTWVLKPIDINDRDPQLTTLVQDLMVILADHTLLEPFKDVMFRKEDRHILGYNPCFKHLTDQDLASIKKVGVVAETGALAPAMEFLLRGILFFTDGLLDSVDFFHTDHHRHVTTLLLLVVTS